MTTPVNQPMLTEGAIETIRKSLDEHASRMPTLPVPESLLEKAWLAAQAHARWTSDAASQPINSAKPGELKTDPTAMTGSRAIAQVGVASESANDWSWTRFQLFALAAETPADPFAPMRRVPRGDAAERWSLARYPILGERAVYLMFEAETDSIERYLGCRIDVVTEEGTYELGEVGGEGVAELRLEGTVDISRAEVRIGRRKRPV